MTTQEIIKLHKVPVRRQGNKIFILDEKQFKLALSIIKHDERPTYKFNKLDSMNSNYYAMYTKKSGLIKFWEV